MYRNNAKKLGIVPLTATAMALALATLFPTLFATVALAEIKCTTTDSGDESCWDNTHRNPLEPVEGATNYAVEIDNLLDTKGPEQGEYTDFELIPKTFAEPGIYTVSVKALDPDGNILGTQFLTFNNYENMDELYR
jgi:hypothetical protein